MYRASLLLSVVALAAPPPAYVAPQAHPELGPASVMALRKTYLPASVTAPVASTRVHTVTLRRGNRSTRLWIYRPEPLVTAKRVPCVLIAPAGTRLMHGIDLGDGDRPEHVPYVRAGMVVVAYELDGALPVAQTDATVTKAAAEFMAAKAGLRNAQDALDYALKQVPEIDPARIYAAGHSSAATVALHVAQHEPRIAAVAAFAPCTNLPERIGGALIGGLNARITGYNAFIQASSPLGNAARLKCPTFLFHATDDGNVPVAETDAFAAAVRKTNANVTYHRVSRGGHYDAMVTEGMPQAVGWMLQLPNIRSWKPEKVMLQAARSQGGPRRVRVAALQTPSSAP